MEDDTKGSLEWICGSLGILAKIIMIYPNPQMHFSCGIQGHTSGDASLWYGLTPSCVNCINNVAIHACWP